MRHRQSANQFLVILFFVYVTFSGLSSMSEFLSRESESLPKAGLKSVFRNFETSLTNSLPFRSSVIKWNNFIKIKFLGVSPAPIVALGKEEWLYLGQGQGSVDVKKYHHSTNPLTEKELADWKQTLEKTRSWFQHRNIQFIFLIAPEKSTIYPEFLQGDYKQIGPQSRMDQFVSYMHEHSDIPVMDVRPLLSKLKTQAPEPIYFKYGAHWNELAVFEIYRQLCDLAQVNHCIDRNELRWIRKSNRDNFYNNLSLKEALPSDDLEVEFIGPREISKKTRDPGWTLELSNPANSDIVFVAGDSFTDYFPPFFARHMAKTAYIPPAGFNSWKIEERIKTEGTPKFIVNVMAERYLMNPPTNFFTIREDGAP